MTAQITEPDCNAHLGMTLREAFAKDIMVGLLANGVHTLSAGTQHGECIPIQRFAETAVQAADHLIAALNGQRWGYDLDGKLVPLNP